MTIHITRWHREQKKTGFKENRQKCQAETGKAQKGKIIGHHLTQCQGMHRSDICMNCTKTGHKAKDCKEKAHCISCGTSDHRMDQTRCPEFRRILEEQRNKTNLRHVENSPNKPWTF
ncbi:hypothetical protein JTB14_030667 [Gonioctena quinquepunctata]|nr:hypothetical protein JTB14_030667 [Gonioctena quinquepunctata]